MSDTFATVCETGMLAQAQEALSGGVDLNATDMHGGTPLMSATRNQNPDILRLLVKAGARVNAATTKGQTPLMLAAMTNPNPDVIITLIELGADVNAQNHYGWTALLWAAQMNPNPKVITALIDNGANIKEPSLLDAARKNKNKAVADVLMGLGVR